MASKGDGACNFDVIRWGTTTSFMPTGQREFTDWELHFMDPQSEQKEEEEEKKLRSPKLVVKIEENGEMLAKTCKYPNKG